MRITLRGNSGEISDLELDKSGIVRVGHDLSGKPSKPKVVGLQGRKLPVFGHNQFLKHDGSGWDSIGYGRSTDTIAEGSDMQSVLYKAPKDLLVYYGYLNSFNYGVNAWTNELVAQDMAKYNMLVFGDGVQAPTHPDYANTQIIIPRIKALNPLAKIFGYVSANQTLANFKTKVDQWNTLGIHGIFVDEAGYDFSVSRISFNNCVNYIHSKTSSKIAFVNAWNTDHILGTANDISFPNSTWNPGLLASTLTKTDWILLESFPNNTTAYSGTDSIEPKGDWVIRGQKAVNLRAIYEVNFAGLGIIDNATVTGQALFNFGFTSAIMWSLDAFGISDTSYASSSATIKWWIRPDVTNLGVSWSLSPSVLVSVADSDVYLRYVEFGKLLLDFSSGAILSSITSGNTLLPGAAVANATGAGDIVAQFNALLASLRTARVISVT